MISTTTKITDITTLLNFKTNTTSSKKITKIFYNHQQYVKATKNYPESRTIRKKLDERNLTMEKMIVTAKA